MNKKIKKYIIISIVLLFVFYSISLFFIASKVNVYGKFKIITEIDSVVNQDYNLCANGVFGSKNEIKSSQDIVYLEGYYKSIEITNINVVELKGIKFESYENNQSITCSDFDIIDENGIKKIIVQNEIFKDKSYLDKVLYILIYELSRPIIKDIVFFAVILLLLTVVFFSLRHIKSKNEELGVSIYKVVLKNISVFAIGTVFWLIVVLLVLEIGLRIAGLIYSEKQPKSKIINDDNKLVILCVGDSFTYGIGSTQGNDYPAQLQRVIQENTEQEVVVINRGRCAQNTTQTIEKLQEDLNSCNPDIVIMLFGMANSWNYYGFDNANTYFERIRIVKLFKRIRYNIKYKGASSNTEDKVDDFAFSFLLESANYPEFGASAYKTYYFVGRYYLALRDWDNALTYLSFSLSLNQNDLDTYDALKICLEEFDSENFYMEMSGDIDTSVVLSTINKLDSFISKYPSLAVFEYMKAMYLKEKSGIEMDQEIKSFYLKNIVETKDFDFRFVPVIEDLFNHNFDSIAEFYKKIKNSTNQSDIDIAFLWLCLTENKIHEAEEAVKGIIPPEKGLSLELFLIGKTIIKIINGEEISSNEYIDEEILNKLKESMNNCNIDAKNEEVSKSLKKLFEYLITDYTKTQHYYFLPHHLKRTADLEQSEVFDWIESDIEKAVEICLKQNYQVVCMNYPIIPPPNSEEISFWADSVGDIWSQVARKHKLFFINNDSIFKSKGQSQIDFFESHEKGSEHCNNRGYGLIAENIYYLLKKENYIK